MLAAAREAMADAMRSWANASSPHAEGRASKAVLEDARARIKSALDWDHELIFTSGASEALTIALTRNIGDATLVSATEHAAVHRAVPEAFFLPVRPDGMLASDALFGRLSALGAKTPVVVVQHVNNESGIIQPLGDLIDVTRKAGGILIADCAQSAGKIDLPDADIIAISAHKLGGPPGIGALLLRDFDLIQPDGGQERGYRGGTENVPAARAFAVALENGRSWMERAQDLRQHLDGAIEAAGGQVVARTSPRIATISGYRMLGKASAAQLIQLDMAGIAVSAGSACSSGTLKTSPVLAAMGWGEDEASEVIRVSFGPDTSRADIYRLIEAWKRIRP